MKNFNKVLQIAANLLKDINIIDGQLVNIFVGEKELSITFWQQDMVNYFELLISEDCKYIDIDCNCEEFFNNWPKNTNNIDSDIIHELIEEFYSH